MTPLWEVERSIRNMHNREALDVFHVLTVAIHFVLDNLRGFLMASVVPMIILILLKYSENQWFLEAQRANPMDIDTARTAALFFGAWPFLNLVGYLVIFSILAVAWHRLTILGSTSLPNRWGMYVGKREMRFSGGVCYLSWL